MITYRPLLLIAAALAVFTLAGNLLVQGGLHRIQTMVHPEETEVSVPAPDGGALHVTVVSSADPKMAPAALVFALPTNPGSRELATQLVRRGFVVAIAQARTAEGLKADETVADRWVSDLAVLGQWLDELPGTDPARRGLIGFRAGAPAVLATKVAEKNFTAAALLLPLIPDRETVIGRIARRGKPEGVLRVEPVGGVFPEDVERELAEPTKRLQTSETTLTGIAANASVMDALARWLMKPDAEPS